MSPGSSTGRKRTDRCFQVSGCLKREPGRGVGNLCNQGDTGQADEKAKHNGRICVESEREKGRDRIENGFRGGEKWNAGVSCLLTLKVGAVPTCKTAFCER